MAAGLAEVTQETLTVTSQYRDFDELWTSMLAGVGPAGSYLTKLPQQGRDALRAAWFERLGAPPAAFELTASAWAARAIRN